MMPRHFVGVPGGLLSMAFVYHALVVSHVLLLYQQWAQ
jgi:hypothetical protein